jgi:predicted RNA-binding Zn ribbon-like protein
MVVEFEFIAGNLALDFANTWGGLPAESPSQDRLLSYADLLDWAKEANLSNEQDANRLLQKAEKREKEAEAILERALSLREAIREIFMAIARGEKPSKRDFDLLNAALEQGMAGAKLVPTENGFRLEWLKDEGALDHMLAPVVRSAAELLTSEELQHLKKCGNPQCRWLFVDTTKNHRRQWCKTSGCGNVMRVRKHRERQQGKEES